MSEENTSNESSESAVNSESTESLLGESESTLADGEYYLSDGVKGIGDKPEWFDSNRFKSVDQQAKSYLELEKKFGGFTGAPKEGYELPEGFNKEDLIASEYMNLAKELNMNQEGFNRGFELLSAQVSASQEISQEAEMAKLGDNPTQRTQVLDKALQNKLGDSYEDVKALITTADTVMLAEALMKAYSPPKLPIDGGESVSGITWADIEVEMNKTDGHGRLLRSTDPDHNAKVERMMKEFGGDKVTRVEVG